MPYTRMGIPKPTSRSPHFLSKNEATKDLLNSKKLQGGVLRAIHSFSFNPEESWKVAKKLSVKLTRRQPIEYPEAALGRAQSPK